MRFTTSGFVLAAIGAVAILGAPGNGWSQPGTVVSDTKISSTVGGFTGPLDNLDEFGGAVANLGDLDGAGPSVVAFAVGSVGDDDGGGNRGALYILFLDANGAILSQQKISDTAGNFTAIIDNADDFGCSLAALGDLDGAGPSVAALAVGAAGDDDGGSNRGAVYILFLSGAGTVLSHQKISDTAGNFTAIIDSADEFGAAIASLGDLDGPGGSAAALAACSAFDDDGGLNRGAVYILFLNTNGTVASYQKISDTEGNFTATIDTADEFGSSVAFLGDLDGAGASAGALAVGAIGDDDGGAERGCVYVLFLNSSGSVLTYQKISDTAGNFTAPLQNLDELGGAVADLGDLDGPSQPSVRALAVGAIGDDDGGAAGSSRGAVYVMFLNASGSVLSYQKISDTQGGFAGVLGDGDEFGGSLAALGDFDSNSATAQTLVVGVSFDDDGGEDRGAVYILRLAGSPATDSPGWSPAAPGHVLGDASPNPFNPRTTLSYRLGAPGRAAIEIYDVDGRLVRRIERGHGTAGEHRAVWDGLDDGGNALASGAYFYRLTVDGLAVSGARKAVLLK